MLAAVSLRSRLPRLSCDGGRIRPHDGLGASVSGARSTSDQQDGCGLWERAAGDVPRASDQATIDIPS